jgi:endogenous inhibitor of DNA gyrase (YacG/DUF329 family)
VIDRLADLGEWVSGERAVRRVWCTKKRALSRETAQKGEHFSFFGWGLSS